MRHAKSYLAKLTYFFIYLDLDKILTEFKSSKSADDECYLALMKFFIDSKKLRLGEKDIENQLKTVGFETDQIASLQDFLKSQNDIIPCDQLKFRDLEWRLEAKVASKSCHNINNIEPKILIQFNLSEESSASHRKKISSACEELLVETNASNLVHIIQKLEQAMTESKSHRNQQHLYPST